MAIDMDLNEGEFKSIFEENLLVEKIGSLREIDNWHKWMCLCSSMGCRGVKSFFESPDICF